MVTQAVIAAAQSSAGKAVVRNVKQKITKKSAKAKGGVVPKRRRQRLLTLGQREELTWVSRHIGKSAASERMAHYRR